jgi:hypothetical protein
LTVTVPCLASRVVSGSLFMVRSIARLPAPDRPFRRLRCQFRQQDGCKNSGLRGNAD